MVKTVSIVVGTMRPPDLQDYSIIIDGLEGRGLEPSLERARYFVSLRNVPNTNASEYDVFTQVGVSTLDFRSASAQTFQETFRRKGLSDPQIEQLHRSLLSHIDDEARGRGISLPEEVKEKMAALLVLVGKRLDEQV